MSGPRVALVIHRYGAGIVGGVETLCRSVAATLAPHYAVDVLTTCARDYRTWRNEFRPGSRSEDGVMVRRFPVDRPRDRGFDRLLGEIIGPGDLHDYGRDRFRVQRHIARSPAARQVACIRAQGPYSSPLLGYLEDHARQYDLFVFFSYLYATTFFGVPRVPPERAVLVPAAHDEAMIHFRVYRETFARCAALVFLTPEERRFVEGLFPADGAVRATIGLPVAIPQADPARFRARYGIEGPFLLGAGRIEPAKGFDRLFALHQAAQAHLPPELQLVLAGQKLMDLPRLAGITYLGFLPEADKLDAFAAAAAYVNPSPYESFSITDLEAMACGTPVLGNGACAVWRGHCARSQAGLYYDTPYEYAEALRLLLADEPLRRRLGANGRQYVAHNYAPEATGRRYLDLVARLLERAGQPAAGLP